ncbi:MAG: T9SS type A sorting domain-containing protein [Ignavibacteria bacterium]|nr:T9SS type A sorting domain-containing protein [Ignavibacteria bacterium]
MKKFITLSFLLLLITSYSYAQSWWFVQQTGTTKEILSISFMDKDTGIIVGRGGLMLRTINGGSSWTPIYIGVNDTVIHGVQFTDANTVYAIYYDNVIKSTNSGINWSIVFNGTNGYFFEYLSFANNDSGTVVGTGNAKVTTNGGESWQQMYFSGSSVEGLFMTKNADVYVSGWTSIPPYYTTGWLLKSTNFGNNFSTLYSFFQVSMGNMYFDGNKYGYVVLSGHSLYRSTNNGTSWNPLQLSGAINDLFFCDSCIGYVSTNKDSIYKTTNCGQSFALQRPGTQTVFRSMFFINEMTGWAAGANGVLIKTINGGAVVGLQIISTNVPYNYSLSSNYPNPFNPQTKIKFAVPKASIVKLIIYDMRGSEVATLVNEELKPGTYEADWDGSNFSSGVYFYKIITDDFVETKKMVLMK